jgi:superfamily II DNA helicase RecQ
MIKFGLKSLVINSDAYTDAQKSGRDLWEEAREGFTMVLLSPEELESRGFFRLMEEPKFIRWVSALGVDKVHLIYWWGKEL